MKNTNMMSLKELKEVNPQAFAAWVEMLIDNCEDKFFCSTPSDASAIVHNYENFSGVENVEEFIWCPDLISTRSDVASGYGWLDAKDVSGDSDDDVERVDEVPTLSVEHIDTRDRNLTVHGMIKL